MSTANQLILNRFLFRTTWTIVFHKQLHFNYYTLARHYILTRSCVEKLNRSQCKSRYDEESGKTLRTCDDSIVKQTLQWMPHGHRGRGRPKNTRNRDLEMWTAGYTYSWRKTKVTAEKRAKDAAYMPHGAASQVNMVQGCVQRHLESCTGLDKKCENTVGNVFKSTDNIVVKRGNSCPDAIISLVISYSANQPQFFQHVLQQPCPVRKLFNNHHSLWEM